MKDEKLVLSHEFGQCRENPKWPLKLLTYIVLAAISVFLSIQATDFGKALEKMSQPGTEGTINEDFLKISTIVGAVFGLLFSILIYWLIFLIIASIVRSQAKKRSLFAATLLFLVISTAFSLIINLIQLIFGLDPQDVNISSLNIFDPGNNILKALSLQTLLQSYLFGLVIYKVIGMSGKAATIFGLVFFVISVLLGMLGGLGG
ncbi:YIP1 family protein [Staphylococcus massiliensis]|uniref:Yip1 domain-containing protein n=1 Tax=Staphylococcus massiliensis S46 TaxID=1229783 RepID=K9ARI5_9STAP|nr:YIP1 family protein [Staphylococcus massiliensis]EKU50053.1 hypothetical protein C273_02253 [Staphylococcus massiliensis S46]